MKSLRYSLASIASIAAFVSISAQTPAPAKAPPQQAPAQQAPAQRPAGPQLPIPAASPMGSLKQRVGFTDIEIVYSRPGAKGRTMLGKVEAYGKVWRTGANRATTISFSTDVKLEGRDLPAGKYALFTIPNEPEWTVIISKDAEQSGAFEYNEGDDVMRFSVKPVKLAESVETFEIGVNDIRDDSATINLRWENVRVPIKLQLDVVQPTVAKIKELMAGEGRKPYSQAASFYLTHNLDLNQALEWADAAIAAGPNQTNTHLKAKILAKLGRKADAIATAQQSIELASKSNNPGIRAEYTKMNQMLIESLK